MTTYSGTLTIDEGIVLSTLIAVIMSAHVVSEVQIHLGNVF